MKAIRDNIVHGSLVRELGREELIGLDETASGGGQIWIGDSGGRNEIWSYPDFADAINAFMVWEPGTVAICALCEREQGGDNPPGPWVRHQPSNRRRIPIFDAKGPGIFGWLHYVRP